MRSRVSSQVLSQTLGWGRSPDWSDLLVPSAIWSPRSRAHLRWVLKQRRADSADRRHRAFRYVHPRVGPLIYHPADYLSRRLFLYDDFERAELEFAVDHATSGGVVLDVGANIGLYTVACARAARDRGRVIAVEPAPATFAKLRETCARLDLSNVALVCAAAGSTNGTARLVVGRPGRDVHQHLADARSAGNAETIEIPIRRLDDVCGPDADGVVLLKMDVEGHEVEALEGAGRILSNHRARLIVEIHPAGLEAAGTSGNHLWNLLSLTHQCSAIVRQDGNVLPPDLTSLSHMGPDESVNSLWAPR